LAITSEFRGTIRGSSGCEAESAKRTKTPRITVTIANDQKLRAFKSSRTVIEASATALPMLVIMSVRCRRQRSISAPTIRPRNTYGTTLSALKMLISIGVACSTVTIRTWKATPDIALPKARMVVALQNKANAGTPSTSRERSAGPESAGTAASRTRSAYWRDVSEPLCVILVNG
jgi:hypothetical protein